MLQIIGILGGIIALIGYIPYSLDILHHKVLPQRSAFFIWLILGLIAVFSQLAKGATNSLWLPSLETFGSLVIFLLSIPFGIGGFSKRDSISLLSVFLGLMIWFFTKEAAAALYLVIFVDAIGVYLELNKAYMHPETETYTVWVLTAIGGIFTAFAVGSWNFVLLSYPIFIIVANTAVSVAIQMGYQKKGKNKH